MRQVCWRTNRRIIAAFVVLIAFAVGPLSGRFGLTQLAWLHADDPDPAKSATKPSSVLSSQQTTSRPDRVASDRTNETVSNEAEVPVVDKKDAEFDRESRTIAKQLRAAGPSERAQLQQSLRRVIQKHFDYRQTQRNAEIERLAERIQTLKRSNARRQENRAEVVDRRFNDLTDANADLNWGETDSGNDSNPNGSKNSSSSGVPELAIRSDSSSKHPLMEPTFKDRTLGKWLELLTTDRSTERLSEALRAIHYLSAEADPETLIRAIMRMSHLRPQVAFNSSRRPNSPDEGDVTFLSVRLLCSLRPEIVIDEFVTVLDESVNERPSIGIQVLIDEFVTALADFKRSQRGVLVSRNYDIPKNSAEPLSRELRRRSRKIMSTLSKIAERHETLRDWVVGCAVNLLEVSGQPLSVYPELIPIVEQVFHDERSDQRDGAASVLAQNDMHLTEVLAFRSEKLTTIPSDTGTQIQEAAQAIVQLYPRIPEGVTRVVDESLKSKRSDGDYQLNWQKVRALIVAFGEIGDAGKGAIPYLRTLHQSPGYQGNLESFVLESIRKLESAKPIPKPEPLVDEELLALDDPGENTAGPAKPVAPVSTSTVEGTFDGVPYSQWLKLLETERKPEKLATAIEACGRLAPPRYERRIARGIFLAARLFEGGSSDDRNKVWAASDAALNRLSPDAVIDELIVALHDERLFHAKHAYQGAFIANGAAREALKPRAEQTIGALLKAISVGDKGADNLLAAATRIWRISDRPLDDFEALKLLLIKTISDGPTVKMRGNQAILPTTWWSVANDLVEKAPETPGLATLLVKHADKSVEVIKLIGKMGHNAESAVPPLVGQFLTVWNKLETENRERSLSTGPSNMTSNQLDLMLRDQARCAQIVAALGEIGVGDEGYVLLRELLLIAPSHHERQQEYATIYEAASQGLKKFTPIPQSELPPPLLSDMSLINGQWNVKTVAPRESGAATANIQLLHLRWLNDQEFVLVHDLGGSNILGSTRIELGGTQTPKQIAFINSEPIPGKGLRENPKSRRLGIYDLTDTTLRIQFAQPGDPRPTEFVGDKSKLPEGQVLFEFERELESASFNP